jgi:hypothetical protein
MRCYNERETLAAVRCAPAAQRRTGYRARTRWPLARASLSRHGMAPAEPPTRSLLSPPKMGLGVAEEKRHTMNVPHVTQGV